MLKADRLAGIRSLWRGARHRPVSDSDDSVAGNAAREFQPGAEYDEETFRYFLDLERARAERANRPVWLLLATLEPVAAKAALISGATAARLFKALRGTLRETDVTGWYRQPRVAGAVLSERTDESNDDVPGAIEKRVVDGLRQSLPSKVARALRVRVVQLRRPR